MGQAHYPRITEETHTLAIKFRERMGLPFRSPTCPSEILAPERGRFPAKDRSLPVLGL